MDTDQVLSIDENLDNPLIEKLRNQRKEGVNTDLTVNCNGKAIKCHRSILTTASSFFESKLKSNKSNKNEIEIDWRDHDTLELILDYFYTGKIELSKDNFEKVLELSEYLSISKLKDYCEQFIDAFIDLCNCLRFKELCETFKLSSKLLENCLNYINDNLMDVLDSDEFSELNYKNVELFFTDPATGCDNIPLVNLVEVLGKWLEKDVEGRVNDYQKLLAILDWSNCSNDVFEHLKKDKLFEDNKYALYLFLCTMNSNGIDLEDLKSTFLDLKKQYASSKNTETIQLDKQDKPIKSSKRSQNNGNLSNNPTATATITSIIDNDLAALQNEEKRTTQGRRQIKRKFDTQEWVTNNSSKKKKQLAMDKFDNEIDKAVYMIKVNSSTSDTSKANTDKIINTVSLINDKPTTKSSSSKKNDANSSLASLAATAASKQSTNQLAQSVVSIDESSNQEFDESEYDIEINSDNKDLLSIKTEYSVRGKKHSATLAQWKEGVKCPKCSYIGHSAPRLEQHLSKVHQEDTTYTCKFCEFTCKWNREYYKHMKTHFKGPPYNCHDCNYTCDRVQFILSHLMRHTNERPFACDQCDFKSRTKGNLVVHYRIHTGEKPYKCQFCEKKFAMKNTLDQHMATHRDDRPYLCDKCGFTTKYQSHLLSHKKIHTGNVFYCAETNCSYFSPRKSQLAAHMRSHLSIRSHVCQTCGRAFIERSHLIRHERIHLSDKPFKCEQCDYGSTRRDKLKEHVLKHHNQNGEKVFKPRKSKKNETPIKPSALVRQHQNSSSSTITGNQSSTPQYQFIQQVHFENAEQIPEEVQEQIIAHYQNQQIEPQHVSITIGDNVYESQLIVTPISKANNSSNGNNSESSNQENPEIQIINVGDNQEVVTEEQMVEFVLADN